MPTHISRLGAALLLAGAVAGTAMAGPNEDAMHKGHDPHAAHKAAMQDDDGNKVASADVMLPDVVMLDQTGTERRMASEIVGDRIVVVDFIFTSCTTICPVTTALMAQADKRLSDVSEDDLALVSMSIDPNTDTPARLTEFAARAGADWTFLTGQKRIMDDALVAMDAYSTNPEDHAPMIIIGDASTGKYVRVFGLPDPAMIEARVRHLLAIRSKADGGHTHHH